MARWPVIAWPLVLAACSSSGAGPDAGAADAALPDAAAMDGSGGEPGPLALATEVTTRPGRIGARTVILDDEHYVVAWEAILATERERRLMIARFATADGTRVDGPTEVSLFEHDPSSLRLFALPTGYVAWYRLRGSTSAIWALPIGDDLRGRALKQVGQAVSEHYVYGLAVAWSGERFALLSESEDTVTIDTSTKTVYRLHLRLLTGELVSLGEPSPIDPGTEDQDHPTLTWLPGGGGGAGRFVALWRENERIRGVRLDGEGAVVEGPTALFETGTTQYSPRAVRVDNAGTLLYCWREATAAGPLFLLQDAWSAPYKLLPDNRRQSLDYTIGAREGRAVIAWESDVDQALSQILVGRIDFAGGETELSQVVSLTDPAHPFWVPQAVASEHGFAVLFGGTVDGSDRLYLRRLEP
jgi:hypothetical protein